MNLTTKLAVSAVLLGAASASFAQITTVPIPTSFPTDGSIGPGANNGGVIIQVWDPLTGHSLTEFTGNHFNDIAPSVADAGNGYVADFGIVGGSALWNATFGGDTNPLDFMVTSAINGTTGANSVIVTLSGANKPTFTNGVVGNAAAHFGALANSLINGIPSTAGQAAGLNPAQTLATSDNGWLNITTVGGTYGGAFGPNPSTNGLVGTSGVDLFQITQNGGGQNAKITAFQYSSNGAPVVAAISASGDFTITAQGGTTPVPVPPAVWLLASGLLGLAGIGRRRAAALAV